MAKANKTATSGEKASGRQGALTALNVDVSGAEFFRPDTKWQEVTFLSARLPDPANEEYFEEKGRIWKRVTQRDGQGTFNDAMPTKLPIVALVDVEVHGSPKVWEITGLRAARAFDAYTAQRPLPCDARVRRVGKGTDTEYVIEAPPAPEPASDALKALTCDAPHCEKAKGHAGAHGKVGA